MSTYCARPRNPVADPQQQYSSMCLVTHSVSGIRERENSVKIHRIKSQRAASGAREGEATHSAGGTRSQVILDRRRTAGRRAAQGRPVLPGASAPQNRATAPLRNPPQRPPHPPCIPHCVAAFLATARASFFLAASFLGSSPAATISFTRRLCAARVHLTRAAALSALPPAAATFSAAAAL